MLDKIKEFAKDYLKEVADGNFAKVANMPVDFITENNVTEGERNVLLLALVEEVIKEMVSTDQVKDNELVHSKLLEVHAELSSLVNKAEEKAEDEMTEQVSEGEATPEQEGSTVDVQESSEEVTEK